VASQTISDHKLPIELGFIVLKCTYQVAPALPAMPGPASAFLPVFCDSAGGFISSQLQTAVSTAGHFP
jgi:hypothetical protein